MGRVGYYYGIGVFLLLLFSRCSSDVVEEEILPYVFKSSTLFVESSLDIPRRSEGDILLLADGGLLLVYTKFVGGYEDHNYAVLVKRISTDKGQTWSDEMEFIDQKGRLNVMSASLLQLKEGGLALFYLVKNSNRDCYPVVRFSADNGDSWSEPTACISPGSGYYIMNNSRAIQLSTGRIVIPVSQHIVDKNETFSESGIIFCCYSDDGGKTWYKGKSFVSPNRSLVLQEPGIVELSDGKILMYIRTNSGYQYYSYSENRGYSWGKLSQSSLESPLAPALIERNPYTKALVVVWNKSKSERMPLCIATSTDEGVTWGHKALLEKLNGYFACYPAIEFLSADEALVLYSISEKEQWGLGSLKLVHVKSY